MDVNKFWSMIVSTIHMQMGRVNSEIIVGTVYSLSPFEIRIMQDEVSEGFVIGMHFLFVPDIFINGLYVTIPHTHKFGTVQPPDIKREVGHTDPTSGAIDPTTLGISYLPSSMGIGTGTGVGTGTGEGIGAVTTGLGAGGAVVTEVTTEVETTVATSVVVTNGGVAFPPMPSEPPLVGINAPGLGTPTIGSVYDAQDHIHTFAGETGDAIGIDPKTGEETEHVVITIFKPLQIGDMVTLLKVNEGQQYYVMDRIAEV